MKEFSKGYFITKKGEVFSNRRNKMKKLKVQTSTGYAKVLIYKDDKSKKLKAVHRIVAETFIPNPDNLPQVNHIDGNKTNNEISNLEWCTNSFNQKHAWKMGLRVYTKIQEESNKKQLKLTMDEAREIRKRYVPRDRKNGIRALAREFNVTKNVTQAIVHNKRYLEE